MKGVFISKRNNGCWKIVINVVKNGKKKVEKWWFQLFYLVVKSYDELYNLFLIE